MTEVLQETLTPNAEPFAPKCISIDLEVGAQDARIHQFAAVRGDNGQALVFQRGNLLKALSDLDRFAASTAFVLGHNLIDFDLLHLQAAKPDLELLKLPAVDTLRLNPLAFPRNPYHHLVKHYQDGQLKRGRLNDPELDARLALDLFRDQQSALRALNERTPELLCAWHWLTTAEGSGSGLNAFFTALRRKPRPPESEARAAIECLLTGSACLVHGRDILADPTQQGWPLAYALAWLSVAGGNSVMPPWVRHTFPEAGKIVHRLRDLRCTDSTCDWCQSRHDPCKELYRWFGFESFRPEPKGENGESLQQSIVAAAMRGEHLLGILPTGTGKSLCYQIPALSRYDKTGALTVVISPLVALMEDQVQGLKNRYRIECCAAINGLLSMPERAEVLDRVRLGDIGILIVSPEQLRNRTLRKVLAQREIGAWVLDEAHCLSKWGQDFRPDYRYVSRFIKERAQAGTIPPILCLTATAKPDVVKDIVSHFQDKVAVQLKVLNGGSSRDNLDPVVSQTSPYEKFAHIEQLIRNDLPPHIPGGAIVYCATRGKTEEIAHYLIEKNWAAAYFHAGMAPESKKSVQARFIQGELRVITATNAFGMGIDKPDVRLVIHADIPGSLENYLQEAGRAGRDRQPARCVLLYTPEDVERQFGMSARSRLKQHEIQSILKSLHRLDGKKRLGGEVVATAGEILAQDEGNTFERDSATDDTRVRTAVAWLEEASLLKREENQVQVFPSSLRVSSVEEAEKKIARQDIQADYRRQLLALVDTLITANVDEGISTDELMGASGLSAERIRGALYDLERLGIASNDTALTAYIHVGVEHSSHKRIAQAVSLERALIDALRHDAPDLTRGDTSILHLRQATQRLKDAGHTKVLPEKLWRILQGLSTDGRSESQERGSLGLRRIDAETIEIQLLREWPALTKTAHLRQAAAERLLEHLLDCLPPGTRGTDMLAETTLGKLLAALEADLILKADIKDATKLLDRALLWLHEQEVIRLHKGLAVYRQAMTIHLDKERRKFSRADFMPLQFHYNEQVVQIHVMAEYALRGLRKMADAIQLALDYFSLSRESFLKRWLPNREKELALQTTPESWNAIIGQLKNPVQQRVVTDDREQTNVLVLAGPGSGKTRVLVHRIAYLIRVKRENARGILALAYNRHAAHEIRKRLHALIGEDAKGVTVLTCHALAMRLAGISFFGRADSLEHDSFTDVLRQAIALLKGEGLPADEANDQRERLLAGFRWILVDEYQDIGPDQYELIAAVAGRTLPEEEGKISLFAVGDDDQNIYAFDGASVEYIRRFETDYAAKPAYLTENYRSTAHIIAAAHLVIQPAVNRMKNDHPIRIDRARKKMPAGGLWEYLDRVSQGRVQVLAAGPGMYSQAVAVIAEFERLAALSTEWNWTQCAVIAREWKLLAPIRSYCELRGIPVQMADEDTLPFWRKRETQSLVSWLQTEHRKLLELTTVQRWLENQHPPACWAELRHVVDIFSQEAGATEVPCAHFLEWLAEWGRDLKRRQTGLLLLTAHRAKGLEFNHVAVIDGGWDKRSPHEDADASRRLYYVAMTRARQTLSLARMDQGNALLHPLVESPCVIHRAFPALPVPEWELAKVYLRASMKDIDLGFAGRYATDRPVHKILSQLLPGQSLQIREHRGRWEMLDAQENIVGRFAQTFTPPRHMLCVGAQVMGIIVRRKADVDEAYLDHVKCDHWEIVIPELVFAPKDAACFSDY